MRMHLDPKIHLVLRLAILSYWKQLKVHNWVSITVFWPWTKYVRVLSWLAFFTNMPTGPCYGTLKKWQWKWPTLLCLVIMRIILSFLTLVIYAILQFSNRRHRRRLEHCRVPKDLYNPFNHQFNRARQVIHSCSSFDNISSQGMVNMFYCLRFAASALCFYDAYNPTWS